MLLREDAFEGPASLKALSVDDGTADNGNEIPQWIDADGLIMSVGYHVPATIEAVIDCSPEAMALCDVTGKLIAVNEPFCRLLGENKSGIIGALLFEVFRKMRPLTETGNMPGKRQYAIYRALKTGRHIRGVMMRVGTSPGAWKTIESSAVPLFNNREEMIGGIAVFRDITALGAFREVGTLAIKAKNADDLVEESLDAIMNAFGLRTAWFYSYDPSYGELRLKAIKGEHSGVPGMPAMENPDVAHHGIVSAAFNKNRTVLFKNYRLSTLVRAFDPQSRKRQIGSMACLPLYAGGTGFGVLIVSTGLEKRIDDNMLSGLSRITGQLALGIERVSREAGLIKDRERAEAHLEALSDDIGKIIRGSIDTLEKAAGNEVDAAHPALSALEYLRDSLPLIDAVKKFRSMPSLKPVRQPMDIAAVLSACAASIAKAGGKRVSITCDGTGSEVYASPLLKDMLVYVFDSVINGAGNDVDIHASVAGHYDDGQKHIRLSIEYDGSASITAMARALAGKYGIKLWLENGKEKMKRKVVILLPAA